MRFERISENQIRCTLSSSDLEERNLSINELTYCSEQATGLFQELLDAAADELNFRQEDVPLMIEAIPLPTGSLMLLITKVDDPEELDTRFSRFTSADESDSASDLPEELFQAIPERADEILELFRKAVEAAEPRAEEGPELSSPGNAPLKESLAPNLVQIYQFRSLDAVSEAALPLANMYQGENSLYKDPRTGKYYLSVSKSDHTPDEFNKVCNLLAEYGDRSQTLYASTAFLEEHCTCIIKKKALQVLQSL